MLFCLEVRDVFRSWPVLFPSLTEVDIGINKIIHMKMVCKKHYHFHMKLDKSEKCTVMHLVRQMFLRL